MRIRLLAVPLAVALAAPASAHTAGACAASTDLDRCEAWSLQYDDAAIRPPLRSDQFPTDLVVGTTTAYVTVKDVALDPADPYSSAGSWQVVAIDLATGAPRWTATRRSRHYDSPLGAALSPDGSRLFVTGAAYDAYPLVAKDSHVVTVAYDAATGAELWAATWDGRPDGTDNGKVVAVSSDGHEVYVGGITTVAPGNLDYVVAGYDARSGRELWDTTYAGPNAGKDDALFDLAADPRGEFVYATGWSLSEVDYDNDYGTVAIRTARGRRGSVAWVARYDGVGARRSDRAGAIAVTPDGTQVVVTGDSYGGNQGGTRYDAATVGYDARTGAQLWEARWAGKPTGLHVGRDVAVRGGRIAVVVQAPGATSDDGLDLVTLGYDATTGAAAWQARYAPPRRSDLANAVAFSPGGEHVYALGTTTPIVQYTALSEQVLIAYRSSDGAVAWESRLDTGAGNSMKGQFAAVAPGGRHLVTAGQVELSQSPLEGPSANRYDTLVAAYDVGRPAG